MTNKQASLNLWRLSMERDKTETQSQNKTTPTNENHSPHLIQQSIRGVKTPTSKFWGHNITKKQEGIFRLGLRNINTLPTKKNHSKNTAFLQDIIDGELDIMCATEINLAWQNVNPEDKIQERFRGGLEFAKYVVSNNKDANYKEKFQRGGTLTVCQGPICARTIASGVDTSTLGRWSWIQVRGRHDLSIIVVTVYRPVYSEGPLSTYQQHRSVLLNSGIDTCPRKKLLEDLGTQAQKWLAEGHQLIIAGDFNEDVRGSVISNFFHQLGMKEIIQKQHGNLAPNTYVDGSVPIDGIFATGGIEATLSGYTSYTWGLYSDHRLLWVDLDMSTVLGTKSAPLWKPLAHRLKCEDPRLVSKFVNTRLKHMTELKLEDKKQHITDLITDNVSIQEWGPILEELDQLRNVRRKTMSPIMHG
jgi:hypothetical protein